jgi:hypothetical protein
MLEAIFFILILAVAVVLVLNVFKSFFKIAVILLVLFALLFLGKKIFGDDWIVNKIKTRQSYSKTVSI